MEEIRLRPIGFVKNKQDQDPERKSWAMIRSEIVLEPEFTSALLRIESHSHLVVIYWLDRVVGRKTTHEDPDKVVRGILATRAPNRPNPIGITVVELIERRKNVLEVRGLDAFNGSPVLDIKPMSAPLII